MSTPPRLAPDFEPITRKPIISRHNLALRHVPQPATRLQRAMRKLAAFPLPARRDWVTLAGDICAGLFIAAATAGIVMIFYAVCWR